MFHSTLMSFEPKSSSYQHIGRMRSTPPDHRMRDNRSVLPSSIPNPGQ